MPLEYLDMEICTECISWAGPTTPSRCSKIAFRPTKETSTARPGAAQRLARLTDTYLPADQVEQINKSKIAYVQKDVVMRTFIIRMNNTKPPFDNINARKAFAHAFNYMGFIDDILRGYATRDPTRCPNNALGHPRRT